MPHPVSKEPYVRSNEAEMTKFKFEIIDLLGKTVWDDFVDAFKGKIGKI